MKVAILGCENSHAWTFAEHIYTNEKYKDITDEIQKEIDRRWEILKEKAGNPLL